MHTHRTVLRSSIVLCCALTLALLTAFLPEEASSSGLYMDDETSERWMVTPYSAASQSLCAQDEDCLELCRISPNGSVGTGELCCGQGSQCNDPR